MIENLKEAKQSAKNSEKTNWLWQYIIKQNSMNILVGEQSRGKSMLAMDLVRLLSKSNVHSESLLERSVKKKKTKCLYISSEMDNTLLCERFKNLKTRFNTNISENLYVHFAPKITIAELKEAVDEVNAEFIVVDVLSSLLSGEMVDINSYQEMNEFAANIRETFKGKTMLFVHHMNKKKTAMGSVGILSVMDTRLEMLEKDTERTLDEEGNAVIHQELHVYGKSTIDTKIDVAFTYPHFTVDYDSDDELDKPLARLMEEVILKANVTKLVDSKNEDNTELQSPIIGTLQEVAAQCKMIEKYVWSPRRFSHLLKSNEEMLEANEIHFKLKKTAKNTKLAIWYEPTND